LQEQRSRIPENPLNARLSLDTWSLPYRSAALPAFRVFIAHQARSLPTTCAEVFDGNLARARYFDRTVTSAVVFIQISLALSVSESKNARVKMRKNRSVLDHAFNISHNIDRENAMYSRMRSCRLAGNLKAFYSDRARLNRAA
jgi:hypothetical protein